ncbi:MAG TPA: type II toxin-antitoxin system VapB family antitoxin [Terracidiphilus sp.]|nr:type II toxin-antitoxin system VapB family antitoxin [Terracidiphilus sp.]
MRTNIDIDDRLMKQAMKATGAKTKKAAVDAALRKVVQLKKQERILKWFGKIDWEGDLQAMRANRFPDWINGGEASEAERSGKSAA